MFGGRTHNIQLQSQSAQSHKVSLQFGDAVWERKTAVSALLDLVGSEYPLTLNMYTMPVGSSAGWGGAKMNWWCKLW